jgi:DNA repair protein RadD
MEGQTNGILEADVMALRPYQQAAHDAVIRWVRTSAQPCLVEAATGAGKSHIIAAVADSLHEISQGKHVLCLAPSAELVVQNREKFLATGSPASMYSASAGQKCLRHPVVFATPGTFKTKARVLGSKFCAVVIDEADGLTPTVMAIIEAMKAGNSNLRVIGLTATPYRMRTGYIYRHDETGRAFSEDQAIDPYFHTRVYSILARDLLDQGYLTKPMVGAINTEGYETLHMQLNARHEFDAADIDRAFLGQGRKTAAIVADIVAQARDRKGVMIFASTIQHAEEVMESLPRGLSAIVTGKTPKAERDLIIGRFKRRELKYIANVSVLTVGFDAPHVDVIALLRTTESQRLLQQIIGRGTRLCDGKENFLVLDYAQNLDRHCPDGDIFKPQIKTYLGSSGGGELDVTCPLCSVQQMFTARKNEDGYDVDKHGYFSLHGNQIMGDYGPIPAHYGRRCFGEDRHGNRCEYRWTFKSCPHCDAPNDIAARYCIECKGEIIDPNEKLIGDFKAAKKDPYRVQTERLLSFDMRPTMLRSGEEVMRIDFVTDYRSFHVLYPRFKRRQLETFLASSEQGTVKPSTVTYRKDEKTQFWETLAFGLPEETLENFAS